MRDLGIIISLLIVTSLLFPKEIGKIWAKMEKGYQIEMNRFE